MANKIVTIDFKNDRERIDFITDGLQLDFLHQMADIVDLQNGNKGDLAKVMNVSNSFISQLFSVDKRMNLKHIARLAHGFNLRISFKVSKNAEHSIQYRDFEELMQQNELSRKKDFFSLNCINNKESYQPVEYPDPDNQKTA